MIERFHVHTGDNRTVMATMPDCSVDSIVTDPPYELGFMGKKWDASGIAYDLEVWRQALRVLKPGGHLISFGGSRTYHRMACAVEDAGFEVRDQILWLYGSGFPKSLNISKAIDAALGAEREVIGQKWADRYPNGPGGNSFSVGGEPDGKRTAANTTETRPATPESTAFDGWGTALKPSHEPAVLARKPLIGTVAANVLAHGTGGLNIGACRVGDEIIEGKTRGVARITTFASGGITLDAIGRWPANLIHDGAVESIFPDGQSRYFYTAKASRADRDDGLHEFDEAEAGERAGGRQEGSAGLSNPRAGTRTKGRNTHPTVKPTELMRYLCRLVTPPGGTVLDPFCGSGSTGRAALLENFNFIGIELLEDHAAIARARIAVIADRGVQLEIA